jgi:proliferating cell nuclear antigen PCNA
MELEEDDDNNNIILHATIQDGFTFRKCIEAICKLVGEATFKLGGEATFVFSSEGLTIKEQDSKHVSLVKLHWPRKSFSVLNIASQSPLKMTLKLSSLKNLLAVANVGPITFLLSARSRNYVKLCMSNGRNYELKIIDFKYENREFKDFRFESKVIMQSNDYRRCVTDLQAFGDTVEIQVFQQGICFRLADSPDKITGKICFKANSFDKNLAEGVLIHTKEDAQVSAEFSLKYLEISGSGATVSDTVCLNICPRLPLFIQFPLPNEGFLLFVVAPKTPNDQH